jgi:lysophospholipase L1-like esterase
MFKKIAIFMGKLILLIAALGMGLVANAWYANRPQVRPQYVALGSSFVAGPSIGQRAAASPIACARSNDNYPHLLARRRHLALVDRSCSGANTRHVLQGGQLLQPAQLDAVNQATELVTVTIGGNDVSYVGNLVALGCDANTRLLVRLLGACRVKPEAQVEQGFAALPSQLRQIASEVHLRAPKARLVFVNYFTVLPESGTCKRLGLGVEAADRMRAVARRLADVTRDAAVATHAELLDLASLSAAHHVCAPDPWLQGMHPEGRFTVPLHPNLEGMQAAAEALDQLLDKSAIAQ